MEQFIMTKLASPKSCGNWKKTVKASPILSYINISVSLAFSYHLMSLNLLLTAVGKKKFKMVGATAIIMSPGKPIMGCLVAS